MLFFREARGYTNRNAQNNWLCKKKGVTRLNHNEYLPSLLEKLLTPGIGLLLVGAVLCFFSEGFSKFFARQQEKSQAVWNLSVKLIGLAMAIAGALMVFAK